MTYFDFDLVLALSPKVLCPIGLLAVEDCWPLIGVADLESSCLRKEVLTNVVLYVRLAVLAKWSRG